MKLQPSKMTREQLGNYAREIGILDNNNPLWSAGYNLQRAIKEGRESDSERLTAKVIKKLERAISRGGYEAEEDRGHACPPSAPADQEFPQS